MDYRKGAKVIWSYVDRILGQPSLVRESTIGKYPWSGFSRGISTHSRGADKGSALKNGDGFGDVILHPSLQKRIQQLASYSFVFRLSFLWKGIDIFFLIQGLESMYNLAQKCMQSKPASSPHKLMELLTGNSWRKYRGEEGGSTLLTYNVLSLAFYLSKYYLRFLSGSGCFSSMLKIIWSLVSC